MPRIRKLVAALVALLALAFAAVPAQAEKRIALVIGNAGYASRHAAPRLSRLSGESVGLRP